MSIKKTQQESNRSNAKLTITFKTSIQSTGSSGAVETHREEPVPIQKEDRAERIDGRCNQEIDSTSIQNDRIEQWMEEHQVPVRNYLVAIVRRIDIAEELCQEVFINATAKLENYQEQGQSRAYLMRIAQRLAFAHFRKHKNEQLLDERQWQTVEPSQEDVALESIFAEESKLKLATALNKLSKVQQRVLWLRYYAGLDFQTISNILDCPRNTAFSHCHRAIENLKKWVVD